MTKAAELAKMGEVLTNSQIGGRRNIIINGAMQVAQRGTDLNDVSHLDYCADRFQITKANTDQLVINYDQSTDTPDGFSNSFKLSVGTVESAIDTNEYLMINQKIEAQNLQHLKYGTSSAETLTLSFHVKSSVTGTYAISVFQQDASKYYSTTYTVNSANTWEYKTVKINGNTSDIINNDNGSGLRLSWTLSSGSNFTSGSNDAWGDSTNWAVGHNASWITTSSATFFLTGVQLEVGSQVTPFEHRSFGEELALCQRYYAHYGANNGYGRLALGENATTTEAQNYIFPAVEMRAVPAMVTSGNVNHYALYNSASIKTVTGIILGSASSTKVVYFQTTVSSGLTDGGASQLMVNNNSSYYIALDSEL